MKRLCFSSVSLYSLIEPDLKKKLFCEEVFAKSCRFNQSSLRTVAQRLGLWCWITVDLDLVHFTWWSRKIRRISALSRCAFAIRRAWGSVGDRCLLVSPCGDFMGKTDREETLGHAGGIKSPTGLPCTWGYQRKQRDCSNCGKRTIYPKLLYLSCRYCSF